MRHIAPLLLVLHLCPGQQLKIATANVWSGLTYEGIFSIGSYEDDAARQARFRSFIQGIRDAGPDILALQEVNPVGAQAGEIAELLGYDVITQRVLSGIKVGPVGIPWNLNEGLAILARPGLELEFVDVIPLSPDPGAFGDVLSAHAGEQNAALIGSVRSKDGERLLLVNTHLPAYPENSPANRERLEQICRNRGMDTSAMDVWFNMLAAADEERADMIEHLRTTLDGRFPGDPVVLLGDFNLPGSAVAKAGIDPRYGYQNVFTDRTAMFPTWDAAANPLTRFSTSRRARTDQPDPLRELAGMSDTEQRTLDHIFVRSPIGIGHIRDVVRILDTPVDGTYASDHYGVMATIDVTGIRRAGTVDESSWEVLPIASYDNDVGFGYGIKAFLLSQLDLRESFDIIAFNSTKGERWYRLVFSIPDFELRQGTVYPLAADVVVDYDRYLKNAFFGVGPGTSIADKEEYTKELFETQVLFAKGLSRKTVMQAGIRYRWVKNSNIGDTSMIPLLATKSIGTATALSIQASFRHDTRNSYINPSRGVVLQGDVEYAPSFGTVSFVQTGASLQYYTTLMYPMTILAVRLAGQSMDGPDIPLQFLLPLGGNRTVRGYPENRFYGHTILVSTVEVRFPLIWRFGAILAMDAGNVWMSPTDISLSGWKASPAAGIRFSMDTFIVRADLGFSSETTGFYLNFGHIF